MFLAFCSSHRRQGEAGGLFVLCSARRWFRPRRAAGRFHCRNPNRLMATQKALCPWEEGTYGHIFDKPGASLAPDGQSPDLGLHLTCLFLQNLFARMKTDFRLCPEAQACKHPAPPNPRRTEDVIFLIFFCLTSDSSNTRKPVLALFLHLMKGSSP